MPFVTYADMVAYAEAVKQHAEAMQSYVNALPDESNIDIGGNPPPPPPPPPGTV